MLKLSNFLKRVFGGQKEGASPPDLEELRAAFGARYHSFKLLLNANNKALEIMSDIEEALTGRQPFGMSFVKASCTALSVGILQIIRNLDELAPGKYRQLQDRFKAIQGSIHDVLASRRTAPGTRLVLSFEEIDKNMADEVGGKMASLGEVCTRMHLLVPRGFVVSSLAFQRFMEQNDLQAEIDRRIQSTNLGKIDDLYSLSANLQQLIIRSEIPGEIQDAIAQAYSELERQLGKGVKVSLRSSALGEDLAETSFAGQYRSELNVSADHVVQAYREVVASKYSPQAMTYRFNRGIRDEDVAMCVGCMAMIPAVAGGVTYSRNPLDPRSESIVINSAWGLPKSVVAGSGKSDLFRVSRALPLALVERAIQLKDHKLACLPEEGLGAVELAEEEGRSPSLSDEEVLELAGMAVKLEEHYGSPQDIEWAIAPDGRIYILQCRPLHMLESQLTDLERLDGPHDAQRVVLEGGLSASPGAASGSVFIVRRNADVLRFPEGAVLVASQPLPRWASLLARAAAVVTEEGGVTGHLASVAREFGVPALFGVPGATEKLGEGMQVTVDADGRRILEGRVETLLEKPERRRHLMEGSPVWDVLKSISRQVVPLNLLDPDAPGFKPAACKTLHDITRFSHEKAVDEMFQFGKEHRFAERSSKQLVCDVAMQLWVINLDDGFKEEVHGKRVQLDNIVCIPMLALWEGMRAIPWQGPPPIDAKGLMSVLFQATTNPALDPALGGPYANRNYFMVSRNYCSLQSRFGFHFSTVEALVGERGSENYLSFQFKGGAADLQRRLSRVVFLGEILREHGFRVEIQSDALRARLEGLEEGRMKEKLKILGYLIVHTRQLDMIMSDGASSRSYRARMTQDIRSLLAKKS